jgi:hypothetical protein
MESADDYPVVAQLGPKWRVVECRDGEQWILQKKSNKWESRSYCRTSAVLERVVRASTTSTLRCGVTVAAFETICDAASRKSPCDGSQGLLLW